MGLKMGKDKVNIIFKRATERKDKLILGKKWVKKC